MMKYISIFLLMFVFIPLGLTAEGQHDNSELSAEIIYYPT